MTKEEELRCNALMSCLQTSRDQALLQVGQLMGELAVVQYKLEEATKKQSNVVDITPEAA